MIFGEQSRHSATLSAPAKRRGLLGLMTALFCVLLLSAGCGGGGDNKGGNNNNNTATITGRVIDQNNANSAVTGALVTAGGTSFTTLGDGTFTVTVPANQATALFVAGPKNANGTAAYYNSGYVGTQQYSLGNGVGSTGFPVPAIESGKTLDVGTVIIFNNSGPPLPPTI